MQMLLLYLAGLTLPATFLYLAYRVEEWLTA